MTDRTQTTGRLQFVWWDTWMGFGLQRPRGGLVRVYRWFLYLGYLEIR